MQSVYAVTDHTKITVLQHEEVERYINDAITASLSSDFPPLSGASDAQVVVNAIWEVCTIG